MSHDILIIDRYPVEVAGFQQVLEQAGFRVVVTTTDRPESLPPDLAVDLLIFETSSGRLEYKRLQRTLASLMKVNPKMLLIAFSETEWPSQVARAMILGANDYLLKSDPVEILVSAVKLALSGKNPPVESRILRMKTWLHAPVVTDTRIPELTTREQQVLRHLGVGLANQEIAASLQVSVETVKELVQSLLRKLGADDRTAAAVKAIRLGLA